MSTMNVSLPASMKDFVDAQVREHGYGTSSEFVRSLIRREQERARVRALVLDGMSSGQGSEVNDAYFDHLREGIRASADGAA
ncbi:ribbon-helix-helix domain-containing protein [Microbacterium sp.]|uniref:ribbon-helix-helix domain-containing protein n=1 Tax=Microbacterium sp. TaxID=51671 RepID=UPI0039E5309F